MTSPSSIAEEAAAFSSHHEKWEAVVKDEVVIQGAAMTQEDVPTCMSLFDTWASCFALGPQFKHIYRYGYPNDCKPKLEDFKYCLTLKSLSNEERRDTWIQRRAEAAASKRLSQSSEDVWTMRRSPLIDPACLPQMEDNFKGK
ncbi:hypothetical protein CBS101457_000443 [Exobasidium rhododendri]|nr:hypothetical protein CBS101457_000443 [Exobasidium rhododendri]